MSGIAIFYRVTHRMSFTKAAKELGVSPSAAELALQPSRYETGTDKLTVVRDNGRMNKSKMYKRYRFPAEIIHYAV